MRGELRNPFAGFSALRLRAGVTDYVHDEVEDGAVSTTFKNKAYDTRVELQHEPMAGFKGVVGLQTSQRKFSAEGEEAYVQPTVTRKVGLFVLEEYRLGDWRFEAALRHDRQTAEAQTARHRAQPQRHLGIAGRGVEVHARLPGGRLLHPRQPRPVGRRAVRPRPAHGHQHLRARQRQPALRNLAKHRPEPEEDQRRHHLWRERVPQPHQQLHLRPHAG
jgi:hypothetical protein